MEEDISKAPDVIRMLLPGFVWHQILEKSPSSYHKSAGGSCSIDLLGSSSVVIPKCFIFRQLSGCKAGTIELCRDWFDKASPKGRELLSTSPNSHYLASSQSKHELA